MRSLTGLLLLGNSGLALGAVYGKREASPVLPNLPEGGKAQPGIPEGLPCTGYVKVEQGNSCYTISQALAVKQNDVVAWNSPKDPDCRGLLAGYYACVDVGPLQPGVAKDCTKFVLVRQGQTCSDLSADANININRMWDWNPEIGDNCQFLQAGAHACVAAVTQGSDEPVKAVPKGRRSSPGISKDCKLFVPVDRGDTCYRLADMHKVDRKRVAELNACDRLEAGAYACIPSESSQPDKGANGSVAKPAEIREPVEIREPAKAESKVVTDDTPAKETTVQDEIRAKSSVEPNSCHVPVDAAGTPSKAPASSPTSGPDCHEVHGSSVAIKHCIDVQSSCGTGSRGAEHDGSAAVASQSQPTHGSTQGTQGTALSSSSLTFDHSVKDKLGSPIEHAAAVQPDAELPARPVRQRRPKLKC